MSDVSASTASAPAVPTAHVDPSTQAVPTERAVREVFADVGPLTVGIEEEIALLHPETLDLLPRAAEVAARCAEDPAVHLELPASQIEVATPPCATVAEAAQALQLGRSGLARAAEGIGVLASMAAHPSTAPEGVLDVAARYDHMRHEYAWAARRQLIAGLQVHVAVRPVEVAVRVHDALRSHLPDIAALAAAAPFHAGVDTGLASVRPKLTENLPRQGVPPAYGTVAGLVEAWRWAHRAGAIRHVGQWWWEVRLHPGFGTIEVRVADAQGTVAESAAVAAVVHCLVADLVDRDADGHRPEPAARWRIEANRWSACRHGVAGTMADLRTGEPEPTRRRLESLLTRLSPIAARLGCADQLAAAGDLLARPAPARHREVAALAGTTGLSAWLAERFLAPAEPTG